ncbi:MAG: hypothetical protein WCE62_05840 [Polyangiales bacterium]
MRSRSISSVILVAGVAAGLATSLVAGCKKNDGSPSTATAAWTEEPIGCDHDAKSNAVAMHSWPYPADSKDLRWGNRYEKMRLRLGPSNAAFITATVTWKPGTLIPVEDSQVRITKPRQLVAKRDLYVTHKVWDQGVKVERTDRAVAAGEIGKFLFYNSRGRCMLDTEQGPAWTPCTLDDAFVGLSAAHPFACEQTWWVKVRKSRTHRGWMVVRLDRMERVPPSDAAK